MTVDLLRKSGLAVLASRRCVLLGEGSLARLCCAMGGSVSIPSSTRGSLPHGTGVVGNMGMTGQDGRCICGPHKLFCT